MFSYNLEDIDQTSGGADVFNGQSSVLWKLTREMLFERLKSMYQTLRSTKALSYEKTESAFENHQRLWGEAIFNEDAKYKYFDPLTDDGDGSYLAMAQGSKEEQRKWWLYNRFRYLDSKYNAGDALTDVIQLRGYAKANITLTPYADVYTAVKFGSYLVQNRAERNEQYVMVCPLDNVNDTEIYIYSASQLRDIGDLSGLKVGFADFSKATKLQRIKLGDSDSNYDNGNLKELYFGNNKLLRTLDVRNCSGLGTGDMKSVDVSHCANLEHAYFSGTAITGLELPNGGILKTLVLPGTVTNLTIRNQTVLSTFAIPSYANITTLWLENVSSAVNGKAILLAIPAASRVRLTGIGWEATNAAEIISILDALDTMRGLDEYGNNMDTAQVSGTIHIDSLSAEDSAAIGSRVGDYPYLTIRADHTSAVLTYKTWDGSQTLKAVTFIDGVAQDTAPSNPSRTSTAQYEYTFVGWSTNQDAQTAEANCTSNVTVNRTVYAAYSRVVRSYPIVFRDEDNTILQNSNWQYGARPSYNGSTPSYGGKTFTGWNPSITNVTGPATYTAAYIPMYTATFVLAAEDGGRTLKTQTIPQGTVPTPPSETPVSSRGEEYEFKGWSPALAGITANTTYTAVFKAPTSAPTATTADGAYGVEWDYSANATTLTRKGLAASFSNPTPATAIDGSGSSAFDTIAPWKDMKRYNVINGEISYSQDDAGFSETDYDTVVYIPEFYYTAYKDTASSKWLWAISPTEKEGYVKHPGSGRYIGRFHTSGDSSAVFTKGGVAPLANVTRANFRTYSHNKGAKWHQQDLATWSAIQMLYLVEFANWHSQDVLGGGQNSGSVKNTGLTTGAAYHTIKRSGNSNMYRWIENPFSNLYTFTDGFVASSRTVYVSTDQTSYGDSTTGMTNAGFSLPASGYITGLAYSEQCPWAFIPDAASGGSATTFVPDYVYSYSSGVRILFVGGDYGSGGSYGFFCFNGSYYASGADCFCGSRLLYIP